MTKQVITIKSQRPRCGLIIACLMVCAGVQAQTSQTYSRLTYSSNSPPAPVTVEAFTTSRHPIVLKQGVRVYYMDEEERIDAELSIGLPQDQNQAAHIARARIVQQKDLLQARIEHFVEGLNKANRYRLERLPAIVFDGKTVIYGVTNIADAQEMLKKYREGQ